MKYSDIKRGGKYYHTLATNRLCKATRKKERETRTIRVVDMDPGVKKVCASINGAPAQWYDGNFYKRWSLTQDPEEDLQINKKVNKRK